MLGSSLFTHSSDKFSLSTCSAADPILGTADPRQTSVLGHLHHAIGRAANKEIRGTWIVVLIQGGN
jgi:hypothetical protein